MSKKLKYKESTGLYRLNLTHTEVELIAALVQQVRLGADGDIYKDAALELCELFGNTEDFDCSVLDSSISVGSSIDEHGDTTIEVQEQVYTVTVNVGGCEGGCPGCSCGD